MESSTANLEASTASLNGSAADLGAAVTNAAVSSLSEEDAVELVGVLEGREKWAEIAFIVRPFIYCALTARPIPFRLFF